MSLRTRVRETICCLSKHYDTDGSSIVIVTLGSVENIKRKRRSKCDLLYYTRFILFQMLAVLMALTIAAATPKQRKREGDLTHILLVLCLSKHIN